MDFRIPKTSNETTGMTWLRWYSNFLIYVAIPLLFLDLAYAIFTAVA